MNWFGNDPTVFELLDRAGFRYDPFWDCYYRNSESIKSDSVRLYPGAVRHYLLTGFVREPKIFDHGPFGPVAEHMGFKRTRKGNLVKMKVIK